MTVMSDLAATNTRRASGGIREDFKLLFGMLFEGWFPIQALDDYMITASRLGEAGKMSLGMVKNP